MPSLFDHIEHLTATAKAICVSAAAVIPSEDNPSAQTGPFTRAVLDTALGDLIRDIDASELGLFTLIPPADAEVRKLPESGARKGEISRVGFPGATPLRKLPTRRDELTKPKEFEAEVYARAALKYLDRYQSIRPMPRARSQVITLIEQLDEVRANINHLNETLQDLTTSAPASAPATRVSTVAEEEERISYLQNRLAELRLQKESLCRASKPRAHNKPDPRRAELPPVPSSNEEDPHEDAFWTTPATPARTLRFTEKLMDEEVDLGEVSTLSFDSPGPAAPQSVFANLAGRASDPTAHDSVCDASDHRDDGEFYGDELALGTGVDDEFEHFDHPAEDLEAEEEKTVVLRKLPPSPPPQVTSAPPSLLERQPKSTPPKVDQPSETATTALKVRVTPELERIAAKIWNTIGEVIMPGNSYTSGAKPPRARETLTYIQSLATQSPSPQSPTSSSLSSFPISTSISSVSGPAGGPTPHQINTAQLLHALLMAPNHAVQLNKLKEALGGTRALYACVAKKLIKIDRGGREQIVLFDI
ncbi:hypothetical protein ID866_1407 [Astraeus odoratus]|nr:hypothetical protein ID866_1407 [Astraeus odoratus]